MLKRTQLTFSNFFWTSSTCLFLRKSCHKGQRNSEFRSVTAALLGWLMVRKHIIRQFANCKDHEYVCLLYLLEDVVPLVFYQYQIFRSGNFDLYFNVMLQMAVLSFVGAINIITSAHCHGLVVLTTRDQAFHITGQPN